MAQTKTFVATQVTRVMDDEHLPTPIKTGIAKSVLQNGELFETVMDELISSIGIRADSYYSYAAKGNYVHGLPSGKYTNPGAQAKQAMIDTLKAKTGQSAVTIQYLHWGAHNNLHGGWVSLVSSHGYNPNTNELTNLSAVKGVPVYLENIAVVVPADQFSTLDKSSLEQWGQPARSMWTPDRASWTPAMIAAVTHPPVESNSGAPMEYLRIEYVWYASLTPSRASFIMPVADYDKNKNYFQVKYTAGGTVGYWSYEDGAGTWPLLDAVYDGEHEESGTFFPFTYFRFKKVSENSDKTSENYKSGKKLAKRLGIQFDQMADAINENPDIADVEQVIMTFAVPANTTNEVERRYLFDFFDSLYLSQDADRRFASATEAKEYLTTSGESTSLQTVSPSIIVQDKRFKMTLRNSGIYKKQVTGSIGAVGTHQSGYLQDTVPTPMVLIDPSTGLETTVQLYDKYHYYQRQISETAYEEIRVVGMETQFHIFDGWSTIGDEEDKFLVIPLDRSITENYRLTDRNELYSRGLQYIFNSVVKVKLAWYQTGLFRAVIVIVAIILAWFTYGESLAALGELLAAGEYAAAAILILTLVLEAVVINLAFKLFVKLVGVKYAFIVAIIAALVGISSALEHGSISGAPFAQELLTASAGISNAASNKIQEDIQDLLKEAHEFEEFIKEQTKLLKTAKEELNTNMHLSPFVVFGESPEDFYNRTVHSGNVGVLSIDAISAYVDIKLTLPKLTDTLGIEGV